MCVCVCVFFQAKGKERQWLKNQALGELDDAKIIDGLTGEKAIYKRRGELDPEVCVCARACVFMCVSLQIFKPHFDLSVSRTSKYTARLTHIILTFICQTKHSSGVCEIIITPHGSARALRQPLVISSTVMYVILHTHIRHRDSSQTNHTNTH